ncbi:putative Proprionate catabolism activator, Fis family [uncultured Eubacteriales bacterium]|uniref:Putative Proprionate catabolism activator, Fis family n=1 Tax=uncultured Eubacteriales bacterium TaxID=172733 RepID=A0A212KH66_9FIRM|nr:putative Proprionate catabolism activator, Fis family [uncultured Eubacteriales bacterium]
MGKIKALGIAPYEGLKEAINTVAENYKDILEITTVVGNLTQGLTIAEEAQEQGYDLVISRGGTSELLQQNLSIPVINIDVSGYDFMRTIKLAGNIAGLKAFIGFPYITKRARSANDLLQTDVRIITIQKQAEIEPLLRELNAQGYGLIIGDVAVYTSAKEMAMNGMLLTSGEESVIDALERAISTMKVVLGWRRQLELANRALDQASGIAIFDRQGKMVYSNTAYQAMQLSPNELAGYVGNLASLRPCNMLAKRDSAFFQISIRSAGGELGEAYHILYVSLCDCTDTDLPQGVSVRNYKMQAGSIADLFQQSGVYDEETIDVATSFCYSDQPMLIVGDIGVGKADLAASIHRYSSRWDTPFVVVNCRVVDPVDVIDKFCRGGEGSLDLKGATFCLEFVESLSQEAQEALMRAIQSLDNGVWRFIATSTENIAELARQGKFNEELFFYFSALRLFIPRLEQTPRDIRKVANLYIIEANTKYGKQITGIEEAGMDVILRHQWRDNFRGLRQALNQMVLLAKRSVISRSEVETVIRARETEEPGGDLSIEGTLEEISLRIIHKVLEAENGNYSRTAARLGIGRSTLWRKLGTGNPQAGRDATKD